MKHIIIAGNWKSNKTTTEADTWLKAFAPLVSPVRAQLNETTILVSAPFTDLAVMKRTIDELSLPVVLGAQDVSPFSEGAYTGEVSARMLKELVTWVIIGHSERRKLLGEKDDELYSEVKQAKESGLSVIYCVPDDTTNVPKEADVIGYEPLWAIGTGQTDTPENANTVIAKIKAKTGVNRAVYGGSVNASNVDTFVSQPDIDGVLVGGASLDPQKYYDLIMKAVTRE